MKKTELTKIIENKNIINAFMNGTKVIDDHNNSEIKLEALIILNSGELCGFTDTTSWAQCLNSVYFEDNSLHLSQCSVGGTVKYHDFVRYNESVCFNHIQIREVIYRDGSKEYPKQFNKINTEYIEEENKMSKIDELKQELEDLLVPRKDPKILDLHKIICNIRTNVVEESKTYKICDKLAQMCREDISFNNDILPILPRVVEAIDYDLNNNILKDRYCNKVANYLHVIETKFL